MPLVVHAHMHPRRTGVSAHVESVMGGLIEAIDVAWVGRSLDPRLPRTTWSLVRRRAKSETLILHAHRNEELLLALVLKATGARLKTVYTRHFAGRPGWFTRLLARRADLVVSLTRSMAEDLGMASTVIPYGVDLRRFAPPKDRRAAWEELGFGGEEGMAVIGRLRPSNGQGDFVEAVAPLLSRYPKWRALLIGSDKGHERWARSLQGTAGPSLCLLAEQEGMDRYYKGLSIVVVPSSTEGFGLTILEAMASGCCVVASTTGAASDLISDGETGFLYSPRDAASMREIVERLLADQDLADEVGCKAAGYVAKRHSIVGEIAALARQYDELSREDNSHGPSAGQGHGASDRL